MDLQIETKQGQKILLSNLGFQVTEFNESPATVTHDLKSFNGRNGTLDYGGQHGSKKISVKGIFHASNVEEDNAIQERVNATLSTLDSYYITQIYDVGHDYEFRDMEVVEHEVEVVSYASNKRYLVYRTDDNAPEFNGKDDVIYNSWEFEFETAELPYGESQPQTLDLTNKAVVPYKGTAVCSQLEQPFYIEFIPRASGEGLMLQIGNRTLTLSKYDANSVYKFMGMSNLKDEINCNDLTNFEYFVLLPNTRNEIHCNVAGSLKIVNKKDLFI